MPVPWNTTPPPYSINAPKLNTAALSNLYNAVLAGEIPRSEFEAAYRAQQGNFVPGYVPGTPGAYEIPGLETIARIRPDLMMSGTDYPVPTTAYDAYQAQRAANPNMPDIRDIPLPANAAELSGLPGWTDPYIIPPRTSMRSAGFDAFDFPGNAATSGAFLSTQQPTPQWTGTSSKTDVPSAVANNLIYPNWRDDPDKRQWLVGDVTPAEQLPNWRLWSPEEQRLAKLYESALKGEVPMTQYFAEKIKVFPEDLKSNENEQRYHFRPWERFPETTNLERFRELTGAPETNFNWNGPAREPEARPVTWFGPNGTTYGALLKPDQKLEFKDGKWVAPEGVQVYASEPGKPLTFPSQNQTPTGTLVQPQTTPQVKVPKTVTERRESFALAPDTSADSPQVLPQAPSATPQVTIPKVISNQRRESFAFAPQAESDSPGLQLPDVITNQLPQTIVPTQRNAVQTFAPQAESTAPSASSQFKPPQPIPIPDLSQMQSQTPAANNLFATINGLQNRNRNLTTTPQSSGFYGGFY